MKQKEKYERFNYEVHHSEDSKAWYGNSRFDHTPEGLKKAKAEAKQTLRNSRFVRVVHVKREVTILEVFHNQALLSKEQIETLKNAGQKALEGLPVMVNEGFYMSMDSMATSAPHISVQFHTPDKGPLRLKKTDPAFAQREAERKEWSLQYTARRNATMEEAAKRLTAAGIKFVAAPYNTFHLKP